MFFQPGTDYTVFLRQIFVLFKLGIDMELSKVNKKTSFSSPTNKKLYWNVILHLSVYVITIKLFYKFVRWHFANSGKETLVYRMFQCCLSNLPTFVFKILIKFRKQNKTVELRPPVLQIYKPNLVYCDPYYTV